MDSIWNAVGQLPAIGWVAIVFVLGGAGGWLLNAVTSNERSGPQA